ncbi:unnamed protein product [Adineta steineri]|uniref:Uncharacterized protein n=1 Tax=Adineta steineri TaxID=433720 RepID=A0A818QV27_9BILA|nr:unnamed protein product [Adineta steineri]
MLILLAVAFVAFVSVTEGRIYHFEIKTDLYMSIVAASCSNPSQYKGQRVCDRAGGECGQCVSFVKVCTGDYRHTSKWLRGRKVRGEDIPFGTAIATFPKGRYFGHAAIYISQDDNGIQVWDQWVGHNVTTRTIRWNGGGRISNNGNSFFVIN